jgi:hypothetical protein
MTEKKVDYQVNGLFGFNKSIGDCLRGYLFAISVDGKEDVNEKTAYVRNITWTDDTITIETLVDESGKHLLDLIEMKKLKVSFLDRVGNRVIDDSFDIKSLKKKYPLKVSHEGTEMVIYRLVFEY